MTRLRAGYKLAFLLGVSLLVGWRPVAETIRLSLKNEEYTHILLIFPVSLALIAMDWRLTKITQRAGSKSSAIFLAVAIGIAAIATWEPGLRPDIRLTLAMLALVAWWVGSFIFCFGTELARVFVFPLCFLLWMVPLPTAVVDWIIRALQEASASCARLLFALCSVPVSQDGLFLTIPGVTLEVAKECSSIRSSMFLWVTAILLAQLLLRAAWRKLVVVAVAIPLAAAKNGLRIFVIGMLGTRVDPSYMTGSFHHHGGILFLLVAWVLVFFLLWTLRRGEVPRLAAAKS